MSEHTFRIILVPTGDPPSVQGPIQWHHGARSNGAEDTPWQTRGLTAVAKAYVVFNADQSAYPAQLAVSLGSGPQYVLIDGTPRWVG